MVLAFLFIIYKIISIDKLVIILYNNYVYIDCINY